MDLGQFLDVMKFSSYEEVTKGKAAGTVTLKYGSSKPQPIHTEYIRMLRVIQDNPPPKSFRELALLADGVDHLEKSLTYERPTNPIAMLAKFHRMGALYILNSEGKDWDRYSEGSPSFGWYTVSGRYELNNHGIKGIEVVDITPSEMRNARAFSQFYPKIKE